MFGDSSQTFEVQLQPTIETTLLRPLLILRTQMFRRKISLRLQATAPWAQASRSARMLASIYHPALTSSHPSCVHLYMIAYHVRTKRVHACLFFDPHSL